MLILFKRDINTSGSRVALSQTALHCVDFALFDIDNSDDNSEMLSVLLEHQYCS